MSCFSRGLIEPPSSFGHVNRNIIVVILHKALTKARLAFGTSVNILIQSKQPHEDTTRIYDDILLKAKLLGGRQCTLNNKSTYFTAVNMNGSIDKIAYSTRLRWCLNPISASNLTI
ncbi:uncharacterized protein PHALS_00774 [Plasmopara halstedii]|uniref:Uncharacterized protein n=1 Tax=Plasmopara halstedii TaxID=4781 RepID=A0A0P1AUU0_PLAHL|nr:uncharacterized protein PHALS_00774 [Plasmopara halstedii]CEG44406.1 hypothetical protein PHALS_00774 [Plasmopara halstedii]|eukprot:XP_024580775.1 hypothetical protein PHALS_00774 [Plasmopara halstedii]